MFFYQIYNVCVLIFISDNVANYVQYFYKVCVLIIKTTYLVTSEQWRSQVMGIGRTPPVC